MCIPSPYRDLAGIDSNRHFHVFHRDQSETASWDVPLCEHPLLYSDLYIPNRVRRSHHGAYIHYHKALSVAYLPPIGIGVWDTAKFAKPCFSLPSHCYICTDLTFNSFIRLLLGPPIRFERANALDCPLRQQFRLFQARLLRRGCFRKAAGDRRSSSATASLCNARVAADATCSAAAFIRSLPANAAVSCRNAQLVFSIFCARLISFVEPAAERAIARRSALFVVR